MMLQVMMALSAFFLTNISAQAVELKSRVFDRQSARIEYENQVYKVSKIMRNHGGILIRTDQSMPQDTIEADTFFLSSCRDQPQNVGLARRVTIDYWLLSTQLSFQCDLNQDSNSRVQTVQFVVTLNENEELKDLQIHSMATGPNDTKSIAINARKGLDLIVEVAAAILASGGLAKNIHWGTR